MSGRRRGPDEFSSVTRMIKWKLKFHLDKVEPRQVTIVEVAPSYPFRGIRFTFTNPESFNVERFQIGLSDQFRLPSIPCAVLHDQELLLETSMARTSYAIKVRNTSGRELPFHAELYGLSLLGVGEVPCPSDGEGGSP